MHEVRKFARDNSAQLHFANFGTTFYSWTCIPPQETMLEIIGRLVLIYVSLVVVSVLLIRMSVYLFDLWKYREHIKYERSLKWRRLARNRYTVLGIEDSRDPIPVAQRRFSWRR